MTKKFLILFFFVVFAISSKEKSKADYIKDLSSEDSKKLIAASDYMGSKKVDSSILRLIQLLQDHDDVRVRISVAAALGQQKKETKKIIQALRSAVENDESNEVVYTSLLALGNIAEKNNKDALAAVKYCEDNKKDDIFIKDIIQRVRDMVSPKKK